MLADEHNSALFISVAARSKVWVGCRSLAKITGSNPASGKNICLVSVVCCQVWSLRRADRSSRGVLPSAVCLCMIDEPHRRGLGPLRLSRHDEKKKHVT